MKIRFFAAVICLCALLTGTMLMYMSMNKTDKATPKAVHESSDNDSSRNVFEEKMGQQDPLYDTSPISQAYLTGEEKGLDKEQKAVLEKAKQIISERITQDMTDYEKELMIHDYIVDNCAYDEEEIGVFQSHAENSVDPYGALVEGKAICSGYTTTFQMFMDMLGIECRSVYAKSSRDVDHAWNMVKLGGNWYHVDVTWDDPTPDQGKRPIRHKYFNVTDDYMEKKHVWDRATTEEANSCEESYIAHNLYKISDFSEMTGYMEEALDSGNENVYFDLDESLGADLSEAEDVDDRAVAELISPQLKEIVEDHNNAHKDGYCYFQRIEYDGRIILGCYMRLS